MWQLIRAFLGGVLGAAILAASGRAEITATVSSDRVNVRGGPSLASEVVCQVGRGATLVVLEAVTVAKPKLGEPANWYKIQLPGDTTVWVSASYIHPTRKSVRARRLNVRAGPGENFSVLGRLAQGDLIREVRVMDDWMEIEPPAGTYAFVATNFVTLNGPLTGAPDTKSAVPAVPEATAPSAQSQPFPSARSLPDAKPMAAEPTAKAPAPSQSAPPPVPPAAQKSAATDKSVQPVANPPVAPPPVTPEPAPTAATEPASTAAPTPSEPVAKSEPEPAPAKPKRIIQREGVVVDAGSIQAPTSYKLKSAENGQDLNFLRPGPLGIRLAPYKGQRIVVTGEEQIDPRWPNLPMIEITRIQLAP